MKEKGKKILKGIGVGALACIGMVGLTGCSIDLTQEQMDKIMYTVDNSDNFMQNTIDLLEKQNAKLNAEEAWDLYRLAQTKLIVNHNNIRDNIKMTMQFNQDGGVAESCMYSYRTSNEGYIEALISDDEKNVIFEQNGSVYNYYNNSWEGTGKVEIPDIESMDEYCTLLLNVPLSNYYEAKQENIVDCEILDNGNYKITFINEWSDDPDNYTSINLLEVVISPDARFISENILTGNKVHNAAESKEYVALGANAKITYEYNVITDADVVDFLAEAREAQVTQGE